MAFHSRADANGSVEPDRDERIRRPGRARAL